MSASLKRHRGSCMHIPRIYCICKRRMASGVLAEFPPSEGRDETSVDAASRRLVSCRRFSGRNKSERSFDENSECATRNRVMKSRRKMKTKGKRLRRTDLFLLVPFPLCNCSRRGRKYHFKTIFEKFLSSTFLAQANPDEFCLERVSRTSDVIPLCLLELKESLSSPREPPTDTLVSQLQKV